MAQARGIDMRSIFLFVIAVLLSGCASVDSQRYADDKPIVIMIGVDGLRWDAIDRFPAPALNALASSGVRAEFMTPVMPTVTFTNFYSLATGLHADGTGITSNRPFSKSLQGHMERTQHSENKWWGGEPIWVTAEKQGVTSAAMFWLGSEAEIKGTRPTHWFPYEHNKPNGERVDQILDWLEMPSQKRPQLITLYFSDIDSALHRYGPETVEEGNAIAEVDGRIADLRAGIEKLGLTDKVNLIVVSDHGMSAVSPDRTINIDDYIDFDEVSIPQLENEMGVSPYPFAHINVDNGDVDSVFRKLDARHPKMKVYKREDIPENWHLNNADRTGDILAVADAGWLIFGKTIKPKYDNPAKGMHGYDRFHKDMQASFIAAGPNFKSGMSVKTFQSVEVYGIIAHILGITPAKTDGNLDNVVHFIQP